jgi:multicomponent Na+:H+ antiporter subunit A
VLGAIAVAGGIVVEPFAALAEDAAGTPLDPAYHLDARSENLMALAAWGAGALLLLAPHGWARAVAAAGDRAGPRRAYREWLAGLNRVSDAVHDREVRDLRNSLAAVFVPAGILTVAALIATPTGDAYAVGDVNGQDLLIIGTLALVVLAAVAVTLARGHLRMVLAISVTGFGLAAVYAFTGAPDVALVALLVETVITLVLLAAIARLPDAQAGGRLAHPRRSLRWRDPLVGVIAGVAAFATIWGFLSRPAFDAGSAQREQIRLAESAHGTDVVTVILADFRGLDTLGEITVLAIAVVGVASLLRRGRLW